MTRRTLALLITLALGLLVAPFATEAQPPRKVPRVGVFMLGSPPSEPDWKQRSPFLQELHHLGWLEGQNITVEYRWAEDNIDRLPALADELVRLQVDVIVVGDTPVIRAAQQATTTIPIVIRSVGDPVAQGFATSLARPGGNITGVGGLVVELNGKLLELLKEAVPDVTCVAVLLNPANPATESMLRDVESTARVLGVQLQVVEVGDPGQFERAFDTAIQGGAGALLVLPAVLFARNQRHIAALAVKSRLPAIFSQRPFAALGGLMAYGPRLSDLWRRVAVYVDKILKGAKPADLPVEQPMTFELVVNLKTAKALGLTIPPTLLFQADEVLR
jgi:putative tryptophan/tyrosine transport system substrate-binding protein